MGAFDDILAKAKAIADKNGDGKIDAADLEALKDSLGDEGKAKLGEAQKLADKNGDGKIDFEDLKVLGNDAGSALGDAKDKVGDVLTDVKDKMFGDKK